MTNKIIYFPMCFSGTDWQTRQALAEKKLICGWATAELYPLIEKTHQEIKNKADLNSLKTKFAEEFIKIVTDKKSKYYKTHYHPWFFNEKSTKIISGAIGNIFRFLLIETSDLLYIKTSDRDAIHIAQVGCDSKISFGKTYYHEEYEDCEYTAFFLDNVEFSEPIKNNNLFEKCDDLLNQKYTNEKVILLDKLKKNINNLRGTCINVLEKKADFHLKEFFREALNCFFNKEQDILELIDKIEKNSEKKEYITEQFSRDSKVREQVIKEANGICQGCKKQSFEKENGEIYLEVHHKIYLSQNGADTVENCVALCPNCHKNEHFGKEKNRKFYQKQ